MALSRIGSTQTVTDFAHDGNTTGDATNEAAQATVWYAQCRDSLLRDFPYPWSTKYAALSQVSTTGMRANQEWMYSYRLPGDCLQVARVLIPPQTATTPPLTTVPPTYLNDPQPYSRSDGDTTPVPFEIGSDATGRLVYTDLYRAWAKYTRSVTDSTQFPVDFADLLAWRLAVEFSYGLAVSDARRKVAQDMYVGVLMKVRANALNEAQRDNPYIDYNAESVRARYGF